MSRVNHVFISLGVIGHGGIEINRGLNSDNLSPMYLPLGSSPQHLALSCPLHQSLTTTWAGPIIQNPVKSNLDWPILLMYFLCHLFLPTKYRYSWSSASRCLKFSPSSQFSVLELCIYEGKGWVDSPVILRENSFFWCGSMEVSSTY